MQLPEQFRLLHNVFVSLLPALPIYRFFITMNIFQTLLTAVLISWIALPATAQQTKALQIEHITDDTFDSEEVRNVDWMKDGRYYTALDSTEGDLELRKYDIINGEHEVLLRSSDLQVEGRDGPLNIRDYQFSDDENALLIKTDVEEIWRRSTRANFFYYNLENGELRKLTRSRQKQQYAELSPDGDKAAFVMDNNLYLTDLESGEQTQITTDGEEGSIINGATDWVYEEEFAFAKAWYWSPDGSRIAFYRFDETHVREFFMTEWGPLYPEQVRFKHPKAGERNATVRIGVYNLDSGETTWMDVGSESDQYIPRIDWTKDPNTLAIRRMNRLQNRQELMLADVTSGETEVIKTETSRTWINVNDDLTFLDNGTQFIYVSEESGYNHIYLYTISGKLVNQVTSGEWDVTEFLGYDDDSNRVYYISNEESPLQRHFYSINIDGTGKRKLSDGEGWNEVDMSDDKKFYIQTFSGPAVPPIYTLHRANGERVRVLEDNADLAQKMGEYNFPQKEFLKIDLPQAELNAYMLKPHDFDSSKKYPLLIYVYGGPGSQTVDKEFSSRQRSIYHSYLTTQGYIVASIDNRGTGGRGRAFRDLVYKKLGQLEVTDQIDAAQYLAENFEYVDGSRIGIWGWSYGGYMSSLLMAHGNDVYKAGIAVAPVTSWRFYDTIYTERYMQTPQLNPEGYRKGSVLEVAGKISGSYLLVHGTGDDNVHFQNAVELVDRLVEEDVQFDTMYYPNRAHSIDSGNSRKHLYRLMTDYILENL